jgi:hypothetical protein
MSDVDGVADVVQGQLARFVSTALRQPRVCRHDRIKRVCLTFR